MVDMLNTSYILGTAFIGLGLYPFFRRSPSLSHPYLGQPLSLILPRDELSLKAASANASAGAAPSDTDDLITSLLRSKGARDVTAGLLFLAHEAHGDIMGVGVLMTLTGLVDVVDGIVLWRRGGEDAQRRAMGHWVSGVGLIAYAWWKLDLTGVIISRWF